MRSVGICFAGRSRTSTALGRRRAARPEWPGSRPCTPELRPLPSYPGVADQQQHEPSTWEQRMQDLPVHAFPSIWDAQTL